MSETKWIRDAARKIDGLDANRVGFQNRVEAIIEEEFSRTPESVQPGETPPTQVLDNLTEFIADDERSTQEVIAGLEERGIDTESALAKFRAVTAIPERACGECGALHRCPGSAPVAAPPLAPEPPKMRIDQHARINELPPITAELVESLPAADVLELIEQASNFYADESVSDMRLRLCRARVIAFWRRTAASASPSSAPADEMCWHKSINEAGFCEKCGVRAAISLEIPPSATPERKDRQGERRKRRAPWCNGYYQTPNMCWYDDRRKTADRRVGRTGKGE